MLEYIIIYQDSGLPIYSKCFSSLCGFLAKDSALLSGFLSAIESFVTEMIGTNNTNDCLKSLEMKNSIMPLSLQVNQVWGQM